AVAVPYKSSNEMMLSVAGGHTLFAIADGPPTMPLVQGGKVRALAVTGSERSSELPDVPSMAEAGYPEVNIGLWSGLFVLTSTPPAIAGKLATESRRALADPGVREKLKAIAMNSPVFVLSRTMRSLSMEPVQALSFLSRATS